MTKKQKKLVQWAELHENIANGKSEYAMQYYAQNRRIDKKKGRTKRRDS